MDGSAASLAASDGTPAVPVLVLHRAEFKLPRRDARAEGPGEVIQEPGEGGVSVQYIAPDEPGTDVGSGTGTTTAKFEKFYSRIQDCWGCGTGDPVMTHWFGDFRR